jgi:hypothetical protein
MEATAQMVKQCLWQLTFLPDWSRHTLGGWRNRVQTRLFMRRRGQG